MTKITIIQHIGEVYVTTVIETEDKSLVEKLLVGQNLIEKEKPEPKIQIVKVGEGIDLTNPTKRKEYEDKLNEAIEQVKQDENKKKWEAHLDKCTPTKYE